MGALTWGDVKDWAAQNNVPDNAEMILGGDGGSFAGGESFTDLAFSPASTDDPAFFELEVTES